MAKQEVWIKNQRSQEVAFPGPAPAAVKIYLERATEVFEVPVPRQTPAPPQSFPEPQPGPPLGFQGPQCEIQVLQRAGIDGRDLGARAERAGGRRWEA